MRPRVHLTSPKRPQTFLRFFSRSSYALTTLPAALSAKRSIVLVSRRQSADSRSLISSQSRRRLANPGRAHRLAPRCRLNRAERLTVLCLGPEVLGALEDTLCA